MKLNKKTRLGFGFALLLLARSANAQLVILSDNFDSYSAGTGCGGGSPTFVCPSKAGWSCTGNGTVSAVQFHSSPNGFNPSCAGLSAFNVFNFPSFPLVSGVVDFWFYPVSSGSNGDVVGLNQAGAGNNLTVGIVATTTITPVLNGSNQPGSAFGVTAGTWHHIVMTWIQGSNGTYILTVDGTVQYTFIGNLGAGVSINQFTVAANTLITADYYIDDLNISGLTAKATTAQIVQ